MIVDFPDSPAPSHDNQYENIIHSQPVYTYQAAGSW